MRPPKPVIKIIRPQPIMEGAGVRLVRGLPAAGLEDLDPFLLFDDFSSDNPDDYSRGFPWHPHRGIETVTYILRGAVDHLDSLGNAGRIGAGDVQWMTSGSGIMHQEMPDPASDALVGFQLWINLPARLKLSAPRYQGFDAGSIPCVSRDDGATIRVIAGEVDGVTGPVTQPAARPLYVDVSLPGGAMMALPVEPECNAFAYLIEGEATFGSTSDGSGEQVAARSLAVFGDGETVMARASAQGVRYLLIAGRPLREPIARYGPFVMNTREEIEEALRELREGTFIREQAATARPTGDDPDRAGGER